MSLATVRPLTICANLPSAPLNRYSELSSNVNLALTSRIGSAILVLVNKGMVNGELRFGPRSELARVAHL